MLTSWGREIDPRCPLPEHPRPQLRRAGWTVLNGPWECAFTTTPERPVAPDACWVPILVPFSPEAPLSGVERQLLPTEWLWYRRVLAVPPVPDGGHLLLHFGAVDQSCTVWVAGHEVGSHTGGYLPFTLDVTEAVSGAANGATTGAATGMDEVVIEVRVRDLSETGVHARGKQRLDRGQIWYTAQSGIWQTVWWEAVPPSYVVALELSPDCERDSVEVTVEPAGEPLTEPARVRILASGEPVGEALIVPGRPTRVPVSVVRPWSPEDPFLYDVEVEWGQDRVTSYVAMRSFGVGRDDRGHQRLLLNGQPYLHVGVLDQGYWPDGLLTAPSDQAIVHDITAMKQLGYTMLRKHVKVEPLRWYHHCDVLGMLVWQDMVNGGGRYRRLVTELPARWPIRLSDRRHRVFFREDPAGRAEFVEEVRRTVTLLRSSPSVALWVAFNEGWGQFDAHAVGAEIRRLDPSRPVCETSGWVDQGGGEVRSFHSYLKPFRVPGPDRNGRVLALGEYGGYAFAVPGHHESSTGFGYRRHHTPAALSSAWEQLHHDLVPEVQRGLAALVYTQLSDVEDEVNGLLTWDREVLKLDDAVVRAAVRALRRAAAASAVPETDR